MTSYVTFVIFAGGAAMRDASGSLSDLANGTLTDCAANYSCTYGLFNSYSVSISVIVTNMYMQIIRNNYRI